MEHAAGVQTERMDRTGGTTRRLARLRGDDTGQASMEYVGGISVAATVVAALILVGPWVGRSLVHEIRVAMCKAFGVWCETQGSSATGSPPPPASCEATNHTVNLDGTVDVTIIHLGGGGTFVKTRTADGKWHVSVALKGEAGTKQTLYEAEGSVTVGGSSIGVGSKVTATAAATGLYGRTWNFNDQGAADSFIHDAEAQTAQDAVTSSIPLAGGLIGWGLDHAFGKWDPRTSDSTYTEVGGKVTLDADASLGPLGADAKGSGAAILGVRTFNTGPQQGQHIVYAKISAEGNANLGLLVAKAGLNGKAEGTVAVTFDAQGHPTALTLTGLYGGGSGVTLAQDKESLPGMLKSLTTNASDTATHTYTATLDLTNPQHLDAVVGVLGSAGLDLLGAPTGPAAVAGSGNRLVHDFLHDGTVSVVDRTMDKGGLGASAGLGALDVDAAVGLGYGTEDTHVTGAQYFDGSRLVPWLQCHA